jgi:salicylate 5-hydroxylase small subunit
MFHRQYLYITNVRAQDEPTRVFNAGHYRDKLVIEDDRLEFREKVCVFDSLLVPNSLIYPQ